MNSPEISDEDLMAFADGELPAQRARELGERAERDPAVADRIALFRASRTLLSRAFAATLEAPVPLELYEAALGLGPDGGPGAGQAALERARADEGFRRFLQRLGTGQAVASLAIAAMLGLLAGRWLAPPAPVPGPGAGASFAARVAAMPPALASELDRRPSGERSPLSLGGEAGEFLALASYADGAGVCREFEAGAASGSEADTVRAVACRRDGRWSLRAMAAAGGSLQAPGDYRPAAGGGDLGAWLGLGQPLAPEEEAKRLAGSTSDARGSR